MASAASNDVTPDRNSLLASIGWRATGLRNRLADRISERRLGIDTEGSVEIQHPDSVRYVSFAYSSINRILMRLELGPQDVFVDIGCGKGRVVCCAARSNMSRVIGVDVDPTLCQIARDNAQKLRGKQAPIEIVDVAAEHFDYRDATVLFLFNPFGAATLKMVIHAIERSVRVNPRFIRIAYVNPLHDALFEQRTGFERYDRWHRQPWSGLKFDVSFWKHATINK